VLVTIVTFGPYIVITSGLRALGKQRTVWDKEDLCSFQCTLQVCIIFGMLDWVSHSRLLVTPCLPVRYNTCSEVGSSGLSRIQYSVESVFAVTYEVRLKKQLRGEHIIQRSTIKRQHEYYGGSLQDGHVADYTKKNSLYILDRGHRLCPL